MTCRDWFQLSLKEGLTVYREQEFVRDLASRTLRRIEDVRVLWRAQFAEDAGPLAHPVRPDHYSAIHPFSPAPVSATGAEIVRMLAKAEQKAFDTEWVLQKSVGDEVAHAHVWVFPGPGAAGEKEAFEENAEKIRQALS